MRHWKAKAVSVVLATALVAGVADAGVAYAGTPTDPKVVRTAGSLASLAVKLDELAATPELAARLPLTGQSPADVLGLPSLFSTTIGQAMVDLAAGDDGANALSHVAAAIDGIDHDDLTFDATVTGTAMTIDVTGTVRRDVPLSYVGGDDTPEEGLVVRGTTGGSGDLTVDVALDAALVLNVDLAGLSGTGDVLDDLWITLDDEGTSVAVDVTAAETGLSFASSFGFTDITVGGTADIDFGVAASVVDPDGSGLVTEAEWRNTLVHDLLPTAFADGSALSVSLALASPLLPTSSAPHGTLAIALPDLQTASHVTYPVEDETDPPPAAVSPTFTASTHLANFANISRDDALTGLAQFAAAMQATQARGDVPLPFLADKASDVYSPAGLLADLVERQAAAGVVCGKANTFPPTGEELAGTTWYCQGFTAEEPDGSIQWSANGNGSITENGTSAATLGVAPSANVKLTDVTGVPDVSVTWQKDGATIGAERRIRTAQELEVELEALTGSTITFGYDATEESLTFDIELVGGGSSSSAFDIKDALRPDTNLAGLTQADTTETPVDLTVEDFRLAATYELLLGDDVVDETDPDESESARYAISVDGDEPEVEIGGITANAEDVDLEGTVGYVAVDVTGESYALSTTADESAVVVDIDLGDDDTALLSELLADITPVQLSQANLAMAMSLDVTPPTVVDGFTEDEADFGIDVAWTPTGGYAVTAGETYEEELARFDVTPEVRGLATGTKGPDLVAAGATFLSSDFGFDFTGASEDERTIDVSLFNVRTGASCPRLRIVDETTLSCVDLDGEEMTMAGGVRGINQDDTPVDDNDWAPGDEYLVQGAPDALRPAILETLYDLANRIEQNDEDSYDRKLPLVGLRPRDMVPQLDPLRDVLTEINSRILTNPPTGCDVTPAPPECTPQDAATKPPAHLAELVAEIQEGLAAVGDAVDGHTLSLELAAPGSYTGVEVQSLVLRLGVDATGTTDAPLAIDLAPASPFDLLRGPLGTPSIDVTWTSSVQLDVAIPISLDATIAEVVVLPTTEVTIEAGIDDDEVDFTGTLGGMRLRLGRNATMTGTVGGPITGTHTGSPVVEGTAEMPDEGDTDPTSTDYLHDDQGNFVQDVEVGMLLVQGDGTSCVIGSVTAKELDCEDTGALTWEAGDEYAVHGTTILEDDSRDGTDADVPTFTSFFADDAVPAGTVVRNTTSEPATTCEVSSFEDTTLTCDEPLDGDGAWLDGNAYELAFDPELVLVDVDAGFDQLGAVGLTLTNTTDEESCTIAAATSHTLVCDAPLTGDGSWDPGDEYELQGVGVVKLDMTYDLEANAADSVESYTDGMDGTLGGGAAVDCVPAGVLDGEDAAASGDACALLSAVAVSDEGDRYIGLVAFSADLGAGTSTGYVSAGIDALDEGPEPLDFSLLSTSIGQLKRLFDDLFEGTLAEEQFPLIGLDVSAGAHVEEALDLLEEELEDRLPTAFTDEMTMAEFQEDIVDGITDAIDAVELEELAELILEVEVDLLCRPDAGGSGDPDACDLSAESNDVGADIDDIQIRFVVGGNLVEPETGWDDPADVVVGANCANCGETRLPVAFDIGLAGLDFNADLTLESRVGWKFYADFGLNRDDGPYVNVVEDQFELAADVVLPTRDDSNPCPVNPAPADNVTGGRPDIFGNFATDRCFQANLGLLQGTLFDGNSESFPTDDPSENTLDSGRTRLELDLGLDLTEIAGDDDRLTVEDFLVGLPAPEVPLLEVIARGNVDFYFITGLDDVAGATFEDGALPSIQGTFHLGFDTALRVGGGAEASAFAENITYKNLFLDAGTFVNGFLIPIVQEIRKYTDPFKPVIDLLRAPIPVLSEIARATGNAAITLLDLLEAVAQNDLAFIRNVLDVIDFAASIAATNVNKLISLASDANGAAGGEFISKSKEKLAGPCGKTDPTTKKAQTKDCKKTQKADGMKVKTTVKQTGACPTSGCTGKEMTRSVSTAVGKPRLKPGGVSFPFLEDSSEVFGLLMGEDAVLVRVDLGTMTASAGVSVAWGPFMAGPVPVEISIGGLVELEARFAMGYDTRGLTNMLRQDPEDFDPSALLDGVYIDDLDTAGVDVPELTLSVTVTLGASVSIKIFKVGLYGGVTFSLLFDLQDPDRDGRLRLDEIRSFGDDPLCMFNVTGLLEFFLGFFVEIDFKIFTKRWQKELFRLKPPIQLFKIECASREPVLAEVVSGNLRLNVGDNAAARYYATDEDKEKFVVRQLAARVSGVGTLVSVEAFGLYQERVVPSGAKVVGDFGSDKDKVEFLPGNDEVSGAEYAFTVPVDVSGGDGDDTIVTGDGADVVDGNGGSDRVTTGAGNDDVDAGDGNDLVSTGLGDDVALGGAGDDNLSGDAGRDYLDGGAGADSVTGGPGLDQRQLDRVRARKNVTSGFDELLDGADVLVGGAGDDDLKGHVGADVAFGGDLAGVSGGTTRQRLDELTGTDVSGVSFSESTACSATGSAASDVVDGESGNDRLFGSDGPDQLVGGGGDDVLCGRGGHDFLDGDNASKPADAGADRAHGGTGDDSVFGRSGGDTLRGDAGNDFVSGGEGSDVLFGGTGADALDGAAGHDTILGDEGSVSGTTVTLTDAEAADAAADIECRESVTVVAGTVDVDGDGIGVDDIDDDGRFLGVRVIDGELDVDASGTVDGADNGVIDDLVITAGLVETDADVAVPGVVMTDLGNADCISGGDGDDAGYGGRGDDHLLGSVGDDRLDGNGGADFLRGAQGDDEVHGGGGADEAYGDSGEDEMYGDAGNDLLIGGIDADVIEGNADADTISGGDDDDTLIGGSSTAAQADGGDTITGGAGGDHIAGDNAQPVSGGVKLLDLGAPVGGNDTIDAGNGADTVHGQAGSDTIVGGVGVDHLEGGAGDDVVRGGSQADVVIGGSGADQGGTNGAERRLPGEPDGDDDLYGDGDADVLVGDNGVATGSGVLLFDAPYAGGIGVSDAVSGDDDVFGGAGNDELFGGSGVDDLRGEAGNDHLEGNADADELFGGAGVDELVGGSAQQDESGRSILDAGDLLVGGADADVLVGDNAVVDGSLDLHDVPTVGTTVPDGVAGDDTLYGDDQSVGSSGVADELHGQSGHDLLYGGGGNDEMEGNAGADDMFGEAGNDRMAGGSGRAAVRDDEARARSGITGSFNDVLSGGDGTDRIAGDNATIGTGGAITLLDVPVIGDSTTPPAAAAGPDVIDGDADDDVLHGQSGDDVVFGGTGVDDMEGNAGADDMFGEAGNDRMVGGSGRADVRDEQTRVRGTVTANDAMSGGDGTDRMAGDNATIGSGGVITLLDVPALGGPAPSANASGPDVIDGDAGDDVLRGQSDHDVIHGNAGTDDIEGNAGADDLFGDADDDDILGGSSIENVRDDETRTRTGASLPRNDVIQGGGGEDVVLGDNGDITDSGSSRAWEPFDVEYAADDDRFPGASGPDQVHGGDAHDVVLGQSGDDVVFGGGGDDYLEGNADSDVVQGNADGDDIVGGSALADVLDDIDYLYGDDADETANTGDGADVIAGDNAQVTRVGGQVEPGTTDPLRAIDLYDVAKIGEDAPSGEASGADRIYGSEGRDRLFGQGKSDLIEGDDGDDDIEGNAGADDVAGGADDDDIVGGSTGGADGVVRAHDFADPSHLADGDDTLDGDGGHDAVLGDNGRVDRSLTGGGAWAYHPDPYDHLLKRSLVVAPTPDDAGAFGDDVIGGGTGDDELHGELGDDHIGGGTGDDTMLGDLGEVELSVNNDSKDETRRTNGDFIVEDLWMPGTLQRDVRLYSSSYEANDTWGGEDVIKGGDGADTIHGGAGADSANGNGVRTTSAQAATMASACETDASDHDSCDEDVVFGGDGPDKVWGGPGHDHLYGGYGRDDLDVVTTLQGQIADLRGVDFAFGGWDPDRLQADISQPNPNGMDKIVDANGAYNAYLVCESAYGGHSIVRKLDPDMVLFWERMALSDGAVGAGTKKTSGFRELAMIYKTDNSANANPTHPDYRSTGVCN